MRFRLLHHEFDLPNLLGTRTGICRPQAGAKWNKDACHEPRACLHRGPSPRVQNSRREAGHSEVKSNCSSARTAHVITIIALGLEIGTGRIVERGPASIADG